MVSSRRAIVINRRRLRPRFERRSATGRRAGKRNGRFLRCCSYMQHTFYPQYILTIFPSRFITQQGVFVTRGCLLLSCWPHKFRLRFSIRFVEREYRLLKIRKYVSPVVPSSFATICCFPLLFLWQSVFRNQIPLSYVAHGSVQGTVQLPAVRSLALVLIRAFSSVSNR